MIPQPSQSKGDENMGKLTIKAAKKTMILAVPFKKPPTIGRYPNTSTKGLKKAHMPMTINMKNTNRSKFVSNAFFFTVIDTI